VGHGSATSMMLAPKGLHHLNNQRRHTVVSVKLDEKFDELEMIRREGSIGGKGQCRGGGGLDPIGST